MAGDDKRGRPQRDRTATSALERSPGTAELILEIAALREEFAAIKRMEQALSDFTARARMEERISRLRDDFEDRLLQYTQALERTHHDLSASYRLLKLATDKIPDPIYVKDSDSRFLMGNLALGEAFGVAVETLIGHTGAAQLPPETVNQMLADDLRVMASGTLQRYEVTVLMTPTVRRRYLITKIPFHDATGRVIGLVGVARDITSSA